VVLTISVNRQGAQGILDGASKAMLENEFGTYRDEDVVQQILEKGEIQEATVRPFPFLPSID
jgi:ribosome maturation protein Sdo1